MRFGDKRRVCSCFPCVEECHLGVFLRGFRFISLELLTHCSSMGFSHWWLSFGFIIRGDQKASPWFNP